MAIENRGICNFEEVLNERVRKIDIVLRDWVYGFVF